MSAKLSGEVIFKVTFDQHGFPIGMYTTAAIIHVCAEQVHARSPFNNPNKPKRLENFKVEINFKKSKMKEETRYGKHNQPKEWYQRKLVEYLKANNPEKLKFNPTVVKIQNDQLTFGMEKHHGRLVMSLNTIDDFHTDQIKKIYAKLWGDSQLMEQMILDDEGYDKPLKAIMK